MFIRFKPIIIVPELAVDVFSTVNFIQLSEPYSLS